MPRRNKSKRKHTYQYVVASAITAEADYRKGTSEIKQIDVQLIANEDVEAGWREKNGVLNKHGMKAQTQGLVQGLIAQIHYAHQKGLWDSAEHYRYIKRYLDKGFGHAGAEATEGKFLQE